MASERTVESHRAPVMRKTGSGSRGDARVDEVLKRADNTAALEVVRYAA